MKAPIFVAVLSALLSLWSTERAVPAECADAECKQQLEKYGRWFEIGKNDLEQKEKSLIDIKEKLAKCETALKEPAGTCEPLQVKVATLEEEGARLKEENERLKQVRQEPGGLSAKLPAILLGILAPSRCDRIEVAIGEDGIIRLSGTAASSDALLELQKRFEPIKRATTVEFKVVVAPGCIEMLNGGWAVMVGPDGRVGKQGLTESIKAAIDRLPTPEECKILSSHVQNHSELAEVFEQRDLTPQVWCQRDGKVGVCRRESYSDNWLFLSGDDRYAYPIIKASGVQY